jgi:hypothetical protein
MKRMKSWVCKEVDDHVDESRFKSWCRQAFVGVSLSDNDQDLEGSLQDCFSLRLRS